MIARMVFQSATWLVALGVLLMWPAGRLDWIQAWVFLGIIAATNIAIGWWLAVNDPGLLRERMVTVGIAETRPWDRLYMTFLLFGFHGWFVFMGFEARRPSFWPVWAQAVGALMIVTCMFVAWRVFRVNSFAAATVKVQTDRAQTVISTGPYAIVRHPMYAGAALWMLGMPLLIGGPWDLLIAAGVIGVVIVRALGEEKMLSKELAGYDDYMKAVRYRLLPGVF